MDNETRQHILSVDTWIRLIYMVLFAFLLTIARFVVLVIALIQFVTVLITGQDNTRLRNLGQIAGKWIYQTVCFLTFNSSQKPFPFDDWPEPDGLPEQRSSSDTSGS